MLLQILRALLIVLASCVCVSAQTAAASSAAAPANTNDSTLGTITGSVVNESGQPFAGVQVVVRQLNSGNQGRTLTTDADGNFRAGSLSSGLYVVSASAPGYIQPPPDPGLPANYNRLGESVRLELVRGGVITGSVTSAAGEPMIAVAVRAWMVRDAKGRSAKIPLTFYSEQSTDSTLR